MVVGIMFTDGPPNVERIFAACDATGQGVIDRQAATMALNALGFYPSPTELQLAAGQNGFPLDLRLFQSTMARLQEQGGCPTGLLALPFAWRGISLGQLLKLGEAVSLSGWLAEQCSNHNSVYAAEVLAGSMRSMHENLYALDKLVVKPLTAASVRDERTALPVDVISTAKAPPAPKDDCSYAQMMNPTGVQPDFFVSHFWGHLFHRTLGSLRNFANSNLEQTGRTSPLDVAYWICLFAVNQHRANDEVGKSPAEGPFNTALGKAHLGVVMVLDADLLPFRRLWCIYEVQRAHELGQPLNLADDNGDLAEAPVEVLMTAAAALARTKAAEATASNPQDRISILSAVANPTWKRLFPDHATFVSHMEPDAIGSVQQHFSDFDSRLSRLVATKLLSHSLARGDVKVAVTCVGLGAACSQQDLDQIAALGGRDALLQWSGDAPYEGGATLLHITAHNLNFDGLKWLLDQKAEPDAVSARDARTPLQTAARNNFLQGASLLLDFGASSLGAASIQPAPATANAISTPLNAAAFAGHRAMAELLISRRADVHFIDEDGRTALHSASATGQQSVCEFLIAKRADVLVKDSEQQTCLHTACSRGHSETVQYLLDARADVVLTKENESKGEDETPESTIPIRAISCVRLDYNRDWTALHCAVRYGHADVAKLLVKRGARVTPEIMDLASVNGIAIQPFASPSKSQCCSLL